MKTKYTNRINSMKNTRLGKLVCRLVGEEKGAVMMEYVIVAVMIAAAVAVGAWLFGEQILGMFGVAGDATIGGHDTAVANQSAMRASKKGQDEAAITAGKTFQQAEGQNGAESTVTAAPGTGN